MGRRLVLDVDVPITLPATDAGPLGTWYHAGIGRRSPTTCLKPDFTVDSVASSEPEINVFFNRSDRTDLAEALTLDASARLKVGWASAQASVHFVDNRRESAFAVVGKTHYEGHLRNRYISSATLTTEARELLELGDGGRQFMERCGTHFGSVARVGGTFLAVYQFTAHEAARDKEFAGSFRGKFGRVTTNADLTRTMNELSASSEITLTMLRTGGPLAVDTAPTTVADVIREYRAAPRRVFDHPVVLSVEYQPYSTIFTKAQCQADRQQACEVALAAVKAGRAELTPLAAVYEGLLRLRDSVQDYVESPQQVVLVTADPDAFPGQVNARVQAVLQTAQQCTANDCELPQGQALPRYALRVPNETALQPLNDRIPTRVARLSGDAVLEVVQATGCFYPGDMRRGARESGDDVTVIVRRNTSAGVIDTIVPWEAAIARQFTGPADIFARIVDDVPDEANTPCANGGPVVRWIRYPRALFDGGGTAARQAPR